MHATCMSHQSHWSTESYRDRLENLPSENGLGKANLDSIEVWLVVLVVHMFVIWEGFSLNTFVTRSRLAIEKNSSFTLGD